MPTTFGSPLDDAEATYRRERIMAAYRPRTPRPRRFRLRFHLSRRQRTGSART
jgi:hypothetical protein